LKNGKTEIIAARSLKWIEANSSFFKHFHNLRLDEFSQTAIAELALLCVLLKRSQRRELNSKIETFLDLIERVYRCPRFHESIYRNKQAFAGHLIVWIALSDRCSDLIIPRQKIQLMIDGGSITSIERVPYRTLELRYLLDLGGFRHNLPSEKTVFRLTTLAGLVDAIHLLDSDIYNMTHTVFYLTDFGRRTSHALSRNRSHTLRLLETLLGMSIHAHNWDLVAELILSIKCLGEHDNLWIKFGWNALSKFQRQDGTIREPKVAWLKLPLLQALSQKELGFMTCYHKAIVTILAHYIP
jgi:hypothetical protein